MRGDLQAANADVAYLQRERERATAWLHHTRGAFVAWAAWSRELAATPTPVEPPRSEAFQVDRSEAQEYQHYMQDDRPDAVPTTSRDAAHAYLAAVAVQVAATVAATVPGVLKSGAQAAALLLHNRCVSVSHSYNRPM